MANSSNKRTDTGELQQRAGALYQSGQLRDALATCAEILRRHPERADVHAFAGMISLKLGDNSGAARFYRTAVGLQPDFVEAHYNLGTSLLRMEKHEEAVTCFRQATRLHPELAPAFHNLGNALQGLGQLEEAAAAYRRTLELAPDAADTFRNLGMVQQKLKKYREAEASFRRTIALQPEFSNAYYNLVNLLFETGAGEQAVEACDQWLAGAPGSVEAMAHKCAALNEAGRREALDYLLDFENFVLVKRWEKISGFDSVEAFNQSLVDHVCAHPTLKVPPPNDPTYHHPKLHITEELLGEESGPMPALEAMMRAAIAEFQERFAGRADHPFVANWPSRWRISSWGVVLQGSGNLEPHIHLDGYLGGVYYPQMPAIVGDDSNEKDKAGWFELGRPPSELPLKAKPKVKPIKPEEGLMILFPGYYYHATVPFESTEQRISVAFDVVASD